MTIINQNIPFIPYNQSHRDFARTNRSDPTFAEKTVWKAMLQERPLGYKFTRQKPIGPYIADFYCSKLKLVIEIDGESHVDNQRYDTTRECDMKKLGIETIRFTNDQVLANGNKVYDEICLRIIEREKEIFN